MFTEIHWLLLIIPAVWLILKLSMAGKTLTLLRICIVVLVIFALAGAQLRLPAKDGLIVVVADRSLSMPADADARITETMSLLKRQIPEGARLALVSFADEARIEMAPARTAFSGFTGELNKESSNLNDGLSRALAMIPEDVPARIIVLSDGQWSGVSPENAAFKAAARRIPVDYRHIARDTSADLAITSFSAPGLVSPGESFLLAAEIYSPVQQQVQVGLRNSGYLISSFTRNLHRGKNSVVFSQIAGKSSVSHFELNVLGSDADPVPENNQARAISEIIGQKPVLVVSDNERNSLASMLGKAGRAVQLLKPGQISWSVEFLAGYSAVVLDNVSADRVTQHGMGVLAAWVKHLGGGLFMTGGKNSYGTGGYYQSSLEAALPVSLELRSEHRKLALALMVVMDRSGSMAAPARGDRTKMDLANIAAASSMDLLSPLDEFGLLAVDTESHVVVPLQQLKDKGAARDRILRVESMGGGIFVYEGLSKAAEMLLQAKAETRHIILFADAADSEQPGRYWELLEKAEKAGMTVSVIGLGTEQDSDANLLRKIAEAGKGRIFFTRDPEELPRLFTQDTFVAARSTFVEEAASIEILPGIKMLTDEKIILKSSIGAYNLCYVRPEAFLAARTTDENNAPLIAAWQHGLGRVACYMGVTEGKHAGEFPGQDAAADIFVGICGWIATDLRQSIDNMPITQQIEKGRWKAVLHLDPDRERELFRNNPGVMVMRSSAGREPEQKILPMSWETADSLAAELQMRGQESLVAVVSAGAGHKARLYPVCLPYSHEFVPQPAESGAESLRSLAAISGGRELIDLSGSWESIPTRIQFRNLSGWLLFIALFLFIVEVAERRMALLTIFMKQWGSKRSPIAQVEEKDGQTGLLAKIVLPESGGFISSAAAEELPRSEEKPEAASGVAAALQHAKKKADKINR